MRNRLTTPPRIDLWLVAVIGTTLLTLQALLMVLIETALLVAGERTVLGGGLRLAAAVVLLALAPRIRRWAMNGWFSRQPPEPLDQRLRARR